ncbi:MAG: alpha-amylase family glycosyl hydrolase [Anaerolineales bacterium]|jgi:glycosidase|nr:alpha-amylase family glycosyl hydrolase [Anaerolineales bacterium]
MPHWSFDTIFYHIYPLGLTGAPSRNDFSRQPEPRLEQVQGWIPHLKQLGVNALYLGPLFESTAHGYDTADYYHVDRRLGSDETLVHLSAALHENGIRLVLDGVFNHVGRDFWAFRDVLQRGAASPYCDWFQNLRFEGRSPWGDSFTYEGWAGNYDLIKLNLSNPDVRNHLLGAVVSWMVTFAIDGLRLDAADVIDPAFLKMLASFCKTRRPDFWLLGEIVQGDYRSLANPEMLDSVTNYECFKGLYSSLANTNYFEIAYALNRQFGESGLYRGLPLYNFVDNHDVNRAASNMRQPAHLYPLYLLLFTMPGVPSIYYGSEWGLEGKRTPYHDAALRPRLNLNTLLHEAPHPELAENIARLAKLRQEQSALRYGDYHQLFVSHEQLAFGRRDAQSHLVVVLNASGHPARVEISLPAHFRSAEDVLNWGERFYIQGGHLRIEQVPPHWGRVLKLA